MNKMQFPRSMTVLKSPSNKQLLGLRHLDKSYIVGFSHRPYAEYVRTFVHENTKMIIKNSEVENVAEQIKDGLYDRGIMGFNIDTVNVDESATLMIDKKLNINKMACLMDDVSLEELLSIPFSNGIGVVFAFDIIDNGEESIMFSAQVLEPINNMTIFRNRLKSSI